MEDQESAKYCRPAILKIRQSLKMYQKLAILEKSAHNLFCTILFPGIKIAATVGTIFCSYGILRMDGIIRILLPVIGMTCISLVVTLLSTLSEFDSESKRISGLVKTVEIQLGLTLWERKMARSLNLIRIKMGSSYVVDKECVLTVLQIVFNSTINFLILNPQ